jgi:iron complex outermembrane recepter protein
MSKQIRRMPIAVAVAVILATGSACIAQAQAATNYDLPAQPLADSIKAVANQSNTNVLFDRKLLAGLQAPALRAQLTPEAAIAKLIEGTTLRHELINEHTIVLATAAAPPKPTSPATGDSKGGKSLWDRFRVAQVDRGAPLSDASNGTQSTQPAGLEEVVVTAQKRIERMLDVPVPVAALNAEDLAQNNLLRLQDYATKIPGLTIVPGSSSSTLGVVSIRGITTGGSTNPTVGITVDDVPFGSSTALGGGTAIPDVDPSDLARVEVLRGPQGTLYGASSLGGLIKYVTVDPSSAGVSGRIEAGLAAIRNASDPSYNVRGAVNIPITEALALRASGFTRTDAGYIDNPVDNENGLNTQRVRGGRVSALWAPSDSVSVKVAALYQDFEADGVNSVTPGLGDLQQNFTRGTGQNDGTIQAYNATVIAKLGIAELTSLTGYNVREFHTVDDFSSGYGQFMVPLFHVNGASIVSDQKNYKFTQELRLALPLADRVQLLVGGFYTHEASPAFQNLDAVDPATGADLGTGYHSTFPTRYKEYAAFGNLTFDITDRFDVQVGGRASWIRQAAEPSVSVAPIFGSTTPSITAETRSSASPVTYLMTPRFKLTPELMAYARIASGYRAGGSNVQACITYGTFPCEFAPDKTQNYELGLKGDFLDHRLTLDGSVYYIDWKDIQLQSSDPVSRLFYNTNASRAKSQGIELSLDARPFESLAVGAWVTWNDAKLTESFPASSPVVGNPDDRLPYSSRFSASVSLEQSIPIGAVTGFVGGSWSYVGARHGLFKAQGIARQSLPSYARTDLRAGFRFDAWSANLFANNVFDKRGLVQGPVDTFPPTSLYIQPRTIGLNVARSF